MRLPAKKEIPLAMGVEPTTFRFEAERASIAPRETDLAINGNFCILEGTPGGGRAKQPAALHNEQACLVKSTTVQKYLSVRAQASSGWM